MSQLINIDVVRKYVQVAIGVNTEEFNKLIKEAQEFDFKPLVCEEFYYDLIANKSNTDYKVLLYGGKYTYEEIEREFSGIAKCLSYFTYARYIEKGNTQSTSFGLVSKSSPSSVLIELNEKKALVKNHLRDANILFDEFKIFMDRNKESFDTWKCENTCTPERRIKTSVL